MLGRYKRTKGGCDDIPPVSPRELSIPPTMGLNALGFLVFLGLVIRARGGVAWTVGDTPTVCLKELVSRALHAQVRNCLYVWNMAEYMSRTCLNGLH